MPLPLDAFERGVEVHVYGTLFAWLIGLIAYGMYQLWHDYLSTIVSAFVLSQALHKQRKYLVELLARLRAKEDSLVYSLLGLFTRPLHLGYKVAFDVPPLMQLALLLALFYVDVSTWFRIGAAAFGAATVLGALLAVVDKQLLSYHTHVVSDEVLTASLVLLSFLFLVTFIVTALSVQSVLDGVQLLVSGSGFMRSLTADAAAPALAVMSRGRELAATGLESLQESDHQWVPILSHLLVGRRPPGNAAAAASLR